jgi:hypothetical protein
VKAPTMKRAVRITIPKVFRKGPNLIAHILLSSKTKNR